MQLAKIILIRILKMAWFTFTWVYFSGLNYLWSMQKIARGK